MAPAVKFVPNPEAITGIMRRVEQNMKVATVFAAGKVAKNLSVAEQKVTVYPKDGGSPYYRGLSPSLPGEFPKLLSGRLRDSAHGRTEREGSMVLGFVGVATEYARRLELGFVGVDAAGRNIAQQP